MRTAPPRSADTDFLWWLGVAFVTGIGGILRFVHLGALSFSSDEGFTLTYSRQSWPAVLGFHGFYSPHPPLSFAFAKLANVALPESISSRTFSAITGSASVPTPLIFALCARLTDRRVALAAALLLTISPIHIEYSRTGRMYAPVAFLTLLSFFVLLLFWQTRQQRWLPMYCLALAIAVYTDYSAVYVLTPQAFLLVAIWKEDRARALPVIAAGAIAVAAFLPWVPQIYNTILHTNQATGRTTTWPPRGTDPPKPFAISLVLAAHVLQRAFTIPQPGTAGRSHGRFSCSA